MIFFVKNKKNTGVGETYINISGSIKKIDEINHSKIIFDKILKLSKRAVLKDMLLKIIL